MPLIDCVEGICGSGDGGHTEIIRPLGSHTKANPPEMELLAFEVMFGQGPLQFASYPALAFCIKSACPEVLKTSLAKALEAQPALAGRVRPDKKAVILNNEGVPFTVVRSKESSAPKLLEEEELLIYADFRRPNRAMNGLEPLMTVKLTIFQDGSAVLAMCRSHCLLDGSSVWLFIGHWTKLARGEAATPPNTDRNIVRAILPATWEEFQKLSEEVSGQRTEGNIKYKMMRWAMRTSTPAIDFLFFYHSWGLGRPRIFFSDEELARIKAAATMPKGPSCDGWVSTQEALTAYLLLVLATNLLPENSRGKAAAFFLLDTRKAAGVPANLSLGCGLTFVSASVEQIFKRSLPEVANTIHEAARTVFSPEQMRQRWRFSLSAAEHDVSMSAMMAMRKPARESDFVLQVNNQSKREIPDWGAGSGGRAWDLITNAGPSLFFPADGGVNVFLDAYMLKQYSSKRRARALEAVRADLDRLAAASPSSDQSSLSGQNGAGAAASAPAEAPDCSPMLLGVNGTTTAAADRVVRKPVANAAEGITLAPSAIAAVC